MNAAFSIGGTRDESAVDVLVKALCHEDEMVCWAATIALGNIGGEKALKGLLIAIKHRNAEVRREATELLGCENVDQTTRNALIKALKDKNSLVRLHAACALARIGYKQALDALISALKNRKNNGFERGFVAFWLGELGGKQALQALLRALNDHDWQLRAEIAAALGKFKEKVSLQALLKLLKDNVEGVRTDAAISLGKIGDKRVLKYLIEALADKSIYVRCAALRGLLQIDPISCTKFLLTALNDEAEEVQDFSTKLLEKIDERTLVFTLIQALEQEDACVKYRATKVSGYSVTDRRFLQKLQQLADTDSSKKVRTAAREAAEKYANKLRYFGG
jgi:HEAT repeat protein